jgi:triosephosphate isomerase
MRKPIIAGNWKMNNTIGESVKLVEVLKPMVEKITNVDIVVAPPFISLAAVAEILDDSNISLAAQNMHWKESGAFTGEVSPIMLKDAGCEYVIIGHSERRQYFGETNETVNNKVKAAHQYGLLPIVCVGETLEQREAGDTENVVQDHIVNGLAGLSEEDMLETIIAYEPVWAIGTGKTATPDQAQEVHAFIRRQLEDLYSSKIATNVRIQYGGSVKPDNISDLISQADVDGALVGGASLQSESFAQIVRLSGI